MTRRVLDASVLLLVGSNAFHLAVAALRYFTADRTRRVFDFSDLSL